MFKAQDIKKFTDGLLKIGNGSIEKTLVHTAAEIVADATHNSPVRKSKKNITGGRLKKAWEISKITRIGNGKFHSRSLTVSNNVHYSIHKEFGHRTRLGTGKVSSKLGGKATVEGQFFLSNAVDKAFRKLDIKFGGK